MKNRLFLAAGSLIFLLWLFFVLIPHYLEQSGLLKTKNILIMTGIVSKEFVEGKMTKIARCSEYQKNMDEEKGWFKNLDALILSPSGEVRVTSKNGQEDNKTASYTLSDEVRIRRGGSTINSEMMIYRQNLDQVISPGPVKIVETGEVITGDFLEVYPKTEKWYLKGNVKIVLKRGMK
ncbi:MAG: LPS export ABC transporter periplasmic protein LptC [Candidatus Wallbacteria bacterium]|nr:LPS export ABC transporter periplasmic protein LptC [Candidatus Wallbacteria bacterium]